MAKKQKTLSEEFAVRGWDRKHFDSTAVLAKKNVRQDAAYYDLEDPSSFFARRKKIDVKLIYENDFIQIGSCGCGDMIVVYVAKTSKDFQPGAVYILSHDYGWGHAIADPTILPKITRLLARDTFELLTLVADENCSLPIDYDDGNESPYNPPNQVKKKMGRKR